MKIVVSMTTWKPRINHVGMSIYHFFRSQTVKPDVFYLWLAEEEFPNTYNDLPKSLLTTCKALNVQIRWTKENEFVHKRWYVFPQHISDLVITIDDDMMYYPTLIQDVVAEYNSNPCPRVIHYRGCGGEITINNGIEYTVTHHVSNKTSLTNYFMGQCAFAPYAFPVETMTDDKIQLRKKICSRTDEAWLHPHLIKNGVPITFLRCKPCVEIDDLQSNSIRSAIHETKVNINGKYYKKADIYKYLVVTSSDELTKSWLKMFPNYNINEFTVGVETLLAALNARR